MTRRIVDDAQLPGGLTNDQLIGAWSMTDSFLGGVPKLFGLSSHAFYTILNQRNLSGLVGEIFKHALSNASSSLVPNPHPDGRPDLLDLRSAESEKHYLEDCFESFDEIPRRALFAPFKYGGLEVKATIGDTPGGAALGIGTSRVHFVKSINYWAHHQHECDLLGLYYDFDESKTGQPEVKAIFSARLERSHWANVSTGKAGKKKTSNTSLLKEGRERVKNGLIAFDDSPPYVTMLRRIGVRVPA